MERKDEISGALTALVTPLNEDKTIDWPGLKKNIEFQISQGIAGVLSAGTTGESPTLSPEEHVLLNGGVADVVDGRVIVLAGTGSNSTEEAFYYTEAACHVGCDGALLVDCYYNGPSSLELRKEYYEPIAGKLPDLMIVPYIIPGRTGCALLPEDLAILVNNCPNVKAVKEATGDLERMRKTRRLISGSFQILSGDDDKTFKMMVDDTIKASGVISVMSNIAPAAVQQMCQNILSGFFEEARKIREALEPLFRVVTVTAERREKILALGNCETVFEDKFRNPLGVKTMMRALEMPAGPCRPPLGKMSSDGVDKIRQVLRLVWANNPEVLEPIENFYEVNIKERLADNAFWLQFAY